MKFPLHRIAIASSLLLSSTALHAELPTLSEKPWLGYFLGIKEKKYQFGIQSKNGSGEILVLKRDGDPVNKNNPIWIRFEILETMPDGKIVSKEIKGDTLTSTSPASEDPKDPITFTGKTTGDAAFECTIIPDRGAISITGKLTDKGKLTNPLLFAISVTFSPYKAPTGTGDDAQEKFEKSLRRDEIRLELPNGERKKIDFVANTNPATIATDGFTSAEIRTEAYDGTGFEFTASEKSKITFDDKGESPLWKSFTLRWTVNEGADPAKEMITITGK